MEEGLKKPKTEVKKLAESQIGKPRCDVCGLEGHANNCPRRSQLKVKKFLNTAVLPTVAHPGEDLAYDLYSAEEIYIPAGGMKKVRTGIGIEFSPARGAILKDRSSMASGHITVSGGVIDAGYRGEILVMLTNHSVSAFKITPGQKIVQMVPVTPDTSFIVEETDDLGESARKDKGFGSSGQ